MTMHMAPADAAATVATTAVTATVTTTTASDAALLRAARGMDEAGTSTMLADVEETPLDAPVKGVAGGLKNFEGLAVLGGLPVAFLASRAFSSKQKEVEERVRCVWGVWELGVGGCTWDLAGRNWGRCTYSRAC